MGGLFNHEPTPLETFVLWAALPVVFVWTPVRLAYEYAMVGLESCFGTKRKKRKTELDRQPSPPPDGLPVVTECDMEVVSGIAWKVSDE
jgi:hypothetical protein